MHTDILELYGFYRTPLGGLARRLIGDQLRAAWADHKGMRIAGFGYAEPYLKAFSQAERVLAMAPAGQGVVRWPNGERNRATLVEDHHWPLPDASIDRLLVVHGLEEAGKPRRLAREAWRVLADDGRVIFVVGHRRGAWTMVDNTPFAAGRPYLRGQIERLLTGTLFQPLNYSTALFFPPTNARFVLRAATALERTGARIWPWFGGVILIEAQKHMAQPVARPLRAQHPLPIARPVRSPRPATPRAAD